MQVLSENRAATSLVKALGAKREAALDTVAHYRLNVVTTLELLRDTPQPSGVADVFAALGIRDMLEMVPR